ncbi:MAG: hypothetical protein IJA09_01520 [Bacteroidales bacterium]|nr:hypothetical protein [Bacteroidales bacterium]
MKKFSLLCLSAILFALVGCTEQTELSTDVLETKVTVMGYVRYITLNKNLAQEDPELVAPGHKVNIFYGVPDDKGKVAAYALKTVAVDNDAFFKVELGCPVGKTLNVRVESSMYGESYTTDKDSKKVSCETYFFGEKEADIACGSAYNFQLDITPAANFGEDGMKQPN